MTSGWKDHGWGVTCPFDCLYESLRCQDGSNKSLRMLLLPDLAALHCEDAVEENQEANQGCWKQHSCVPAEPGKVQANLLSEIPPGDGNVRARGKKVSGSYKTACFSGSASILSGQSNFTWWGPVVDTCTKPPTRPSTRTAGAGGSLLRAFWLNSCCDTSPDMEGHAVTLCLLTAILATTCKVPTGGKQREAFLPHGEGKLLHMNYCLKDD